MSMRRFLLLGCAAIALAVGLHRDDVIAFHPKPTRRRDAA